MGSSWARLRVLPSPLPRDVEDEEEEESSMSEEATPFEAFWAAYPRKVLH